MDSQDIKGVLYKIIDLIDYAEKTLALPDCNDCAHVKTCKYAPEVGERTRINCPLWGPREEKE